MTHSGNADGISSNSAAVKFRKIPLSKLQIQCLAHHFHYYFFGNICYSNNHITSYKCPNYDLVMLLLYCSNLCLHRICRVITQLWGGGAADIVIEFLVHCIFFFNESVFGGKGP